jgi:mannose/fructose/N-acetylgalactosamine-specific phosphotransferase system component IIC
MTLVSLLPLAALGAVLGLDVVSFPQAMLSRPLVAATIAGALAGHPGQGLVVGAVLEMFALETQMFGASRYPEWGSASVVGGALFAAQAEATAGALVVAVFAALMTAGVGSWTMVMHRKAIGRWAGGMREALAHGSRGAVTSLQLRGLTADLVRGGLLTFAALAVSGPLARMVLAVWAIGAVPSRSVVVAVAGAVGLGAVWKVVHTTRGAPWYLLGGLAVGGVLLLVT